MPYISSGDLASSHSWSPCRQCPAIYADMHVAKHDEQACATAEACGRATKNARVVLMQRAGGALTAAVRSIWVPASVDGWLRSLAAAAADRRASGKARELPAAIPAGPRRIAFRRTSRAVLPAWATP